MFKFFNITTLLLFVCFLFAPTISYALNSDVDTYSLLVNEEEETHSKNKPKNNNNNLNEEEEKEIKYHFFCNAKVLFGSKKAPNSSLFLYGQQLRNILVFKIPSPPPEPQL